MVHGLSEPSSAGAVETSTPLAVVSADSHIGPRLVEDLRPYCPKRYLERFDEFVRMHGAGRSGGMESALRTQRPAAARQSEANARTAGHHDMRARLRDMDSHGIAAAVIFHGSQNGQPIPWQSNVALIRGDDPTPEELELMGVGRHIYNQWLADACSVEPERHAGCAQLPVWDVDATVKEIEWARQAGLRTVNWPAPASGALNTTSPTGSRSGQRAQRWRCRSQHTPVRSYRACCGPTRRSPGIVGLSSISRPGAGRRAGECPEWCSRESLLGTRTSSSF